MRALGCRSLFLSSERNEPSLTFSTAPGHTPHPVLFGGNKLTQELMFPAEKAKLEQLPPGADSGVPDHGQYTRQFELDGFALPAEVGLDLQVNPALGLRLIGLE